MTLPTPNPVAGPTAATQSSPDWQACRSDPITDDFAGRCFGATGARRIASLPTKLERSYLVLMLSIFNAVPVLVGGQPQGALSLNSVESLENVSKQGDANKQAILLGLYAGCTVFLLLRTQVRMFLFLGAPLLMLIAWCFASAGWSGDPDLAFRRCAALLGTVILGTYAGLRFDLREMLRLMSYVTGIVLISSLAVAVISPSLGLDFEGRLRGVFSHKNFLGAFAALALFTVVASLSEAKYRSKMAVISEVLLAVICVLCLTLSHSASPIPVLAITLLLLLAARVVRSAHGTVLALLPAIASIALVALPVFAYDLDGVASILGHDADLSGRTLIWDFASKMVLKHPWLGYGYGTFWTGIDSPGAAFWRLSHIAAPHAHNGYLQLVLDAGGIALTLLLAAVVTLAFRVAWLLRHSRQPHIAWCFAFLGFFLFSNLTETRLWIGNEIATALFVYVVVQINILISRAKITGSAVAWPS